MGPCQGTIAGIDNRDRVIRRIANFAQEITGLFNRKSGQEIAEVHRLIRTWQSSLRVNVLTSIKLPIAIAVDKNSSACTGHQNAVDPPRWSPRIGIGLIPARHTIRRQFIDLINPISNGHTHGIAAINLIRGSYDIIDGIRTIPIHIKNNGPKTQAFFPCIDQAIGITVMPLQALQTEGELCRDITKTRQIIGYASGLDFGCDHKIGHRGGFRTNPRGIGAIFWTCLGIGHHQVGDRLAHMEGGERSQASR